MSDKKKFIAIYLGSANGQKMKQWEALNPKERQEKERAGMDAWGAWVEKNKKMLVDVGAPLGKTKLINSQGVSDTKNLMTAYTVIEADSHQAAAEIFKNHPHFSIFPGESIEIMECLPIPTRK